MLASELDQAFQVLRGAPTPAISPTAPSAAKPEPARASPKSVKLIAPEKVTKKAAGLTKAKKDNHSNKHRGIKAPATRPSTRKTSPAQNNRPKVKLYR